MFIYMRIPIGSILACQRNLKRRWQLDGLVFAIQAGTRLPPIELVLSASGEYAVHNGHHRTVAYWLAGYDCLPDHAFVVLHNQPRPTFGPVIGLAEQKTNGMRHPYGRGAA